MDDQNARPGSPRLLLGMKFILLFPLVLEQVVLQLLILDPNATTHLLLSFHLTDMIFLLDVQVLANFVDGGLSRCALFLNNRRALSSGVKNDCCFFHTIE